jgi:hypothetical protein
LLKLGIAIAVDFADAIVAKAMALFNFVYSLPNVSPLPAEPRQGFVYMRRDQQSPMFILWPSAQPAVAFCILALAFACTDFQRTTATENLADDANARIKLCEGSAFFRCVVNFYELADGYWWSKAVVTGW